MIKMSQLPFKTQKTKTKISDHESTSILLHAWFIRQTMTWVYNYTTLWLRVLRKIEQIVREEMNNFWASEVFMSGLSPMDVWQKTWRDDISEYFKVPTWWDKFYRLNPTHEEIVVPLMKEFIKSYKDSETCVYQIQTKYRNEKRAKSWLLRWREFLMKDAYSFHLNDNEFQKYYEGMKEAYMNVFKRLWLWKDTYITVADGWVFTEKFSHEFQTLLWIWEDTIYIDESSMECFNQEVAPVKVWKEFNNVWEEMKARDDVLWEWIIWVTDLAKFFRIEVERTTKTILFETDNWDSIAAAIRWDYDINEIKLRKVIWCNSLALLSEEKVRELTKAEVWYAWVIGLPKNVKVYWDDSCENRLNFEMWANKTDYHSININFDRDIKKPKTFYDFKDAKAWDKNPSTWNVYRVEKASEVWNIFPLETKFSKPFWVKMLDKNNKEQDVIMWCYGIWVSRLMWVCAEYFLNKWWNISWPDSIAPAAYYIIVIWEENLEKAIEIAKDLEEAWEEVIIDDRMDRKIWFWQKAWDCELFWIPNRIVISPKTLEKWGYELKQRWKKEKIIKII